MAGLCEGGNEPPDSLKKAIESPLFPAWLRLPHCRYRLAPCACIVAEFARKPSRLLIGTRKLLADLITRVLTTTAVNYVSFNYARNCRDYISVADVPEF
ncbi:hypothetical protein ANN_00993 [Periplaneta americana]|uniref:Uncharacterized protein n=1 Tax=Periplaneta americana TaxID=6978 RepID=A0ABQ8TSD4_PERAM|nr:hypothetical protein ANN_00993 [Periplaneta americana]